MGLCFGDSTWTLLDISTYISLKVRFPENHIFVATNVNKLHWCERPAVSNNSRTFETSPKYLPSRSISKSLIKPLPLTSTHTSTCVYHTHMHMHTHRQRNKACVHYLLFDRCILRNLIQYYSNLVVHFSPVQVTSTSELVTMDHRTE